MAWYKNQSQKVIWGGNRKNEMKGGCSFFDSSFLYRQHKDDNIFLASSFNTMIVNLQPDVKYVKAASNVNQSTQKIFRITLFQEILC